jgi:WD40 repeat protein
MAVSIWWFRQPKPILVLHHHIEIADALISPDGNTLITSRVISVGKSTRWSNLSAGFIWDTNIGEEITRIGPLSLFTTFDFMKFSNNGRYLLTKTDGIHPNGIQIWDTATWQVVRQYDGCELCAMDISATGQLVVLTYFGPNEDHLLTIRNVETAELTKLAYLGNATTSDYAVIFSPDERSLAVVTNQTDAKGHIQVWVLATREEVQRITNSSAFNYLVWSANGHQIITKSHDGFVRIWDIETKQQINQLELGPAYRLKFSPNERYLFVWDTSGIRVIDTRKWVEIALIPRIEGRQFDLQFTEKGAYLVSVSGGTVNLYNLADFVLLE